MITVLPIFFGNINHLLLLPAADGYSVQIRIDFPDDRIPFKDCRLMPEPTTKVNLFQCVREPIHIVMIGDSTHRLQKSIIQMYAGSNPMIHVSFIELYGGYFKTQLLTGPNVRQFLAEAAKGNERHGIKVDVLPLWDVGLVIVVP